MDLLSDSLQQAGLQRRLLDARRLADTTALRFPCDKSIGFHVALRGKLYLHIAGRDEPLTLRAGDMALMARGCDHVVATTPTLPKGAIEPLGGGEPDTRGAAVLSGAYQFWNEPLHPLFSQLPAWTVVPADSLPRLAPMSLTAALLESEVAAPTLGSDILVQGLFDMTFAYLLREIVERAGIDTTGWSRALRDAPLRRAVELMHADSAHAWTLDELAKQSRLSRTALAKRFHDAMGDTPLNYLRKLRVQKAMRMLATTDAGLDQVASEVGYADAFSFSKTFKKMVGVAPREFRRRDAADRGAPHRF